jgi:hypothetical protein
MLPLFSESLFLQISWSFFASKYNLCCSKATFLPQNKFCLLQNEFYLSQNEFCLPQNKFCLGQNEFYLSQNKFCLGQNKFCLRQVKRSLGTDPVFFSVISIAPRGNPERPRGKPERPRGKPERPRGNPERPRGRQREKFASSCGQGVVAQCILVGEKRFWVLTVLS